MISIIIPIYNDEKYISQCLDSILKQTFKDFECLCLDDGSQDKTLSIINNYISIDKRIKLFQNEHKGPGWERNFGIENASGEFITFMDHDDFVNPFWLEKLYLTLINNNVDIAYCANSDYYDETQTTKSYLFPKCLKKIVHYTPKNIPETFVYEWFAPWRRLIRTKLLKDHNIRFAEGDFKFDDVLFTEELLLNTNSLAICNEVLYYHRIFSTSITGSSFSNRDMYFEHFKTVEKLKEYSKKQNLDCTPILLKMFPMFKYYLFYVSSKEDFYKKFREIVYENNFPLLYKIKLFKYYISINRKKIFTKKTNL